MHLQFYDADSLKKWSKATLDQFTLCHGVATRLVQQVARGQLYIRLHSETICYAGKSIDDKKSSPHCSSTTVVGLVREAHAQSTNQHCGCHDSVEQSERDGRSDKQHDQSGSIEQK